MMKVQLGGVVFGWIADLQTLKYQSYPTMIGKSKRHTDRWQ